MSLAQTKAAVILQEKSDQLSSHQVISLMMDGALERVGQAQECVQSGNENDAELLVGKLAGIINGLRASLNMDAGGEIAVNLDALYAYMVDRLADSNGRDVNALAEVQRLIGELKSGWDAIDSELSEAC
jgi:flagellar protein FliS